MEFFTGLCLGFFWGITFVEICDKLKKKYGSGGIKPPADNKKNECFSFGKKEIIENKFEEEQLEKFKLLKEKLSELNNNILKEN